MKRVYWTHWAKGLNLPREGDTILLTGRMYQMLPYIIQVTDLVAAAKPFLSRSGFGAVVNIGNALMGDRIIRLKALGSQQLKKTSTDILRGIVAALSVAGQIPSYLYEDEPYSGVLLYDLGMDEYIEEHIRKVYDLLKGRNVKKVIGVDPHTVFMLKEIYPKYIDGYDIQVVHYLDILAENAEALKKACKGAPIEELVIHDSCYMARNLSHVEQIRTVAAALGITLKEPENTKLDTACCGGPIEYAFRDLTEKISKSRINELAAVSTNILVECPICLINLNKYEQEMGVKVWDVGGLLFSALPADAPR
jgi:Fe-S oxidoreductase